MNLGVVPDDAIPPLRRLEMARDDLAERQVVNERLRAAHDALERAQTERRALRDRLTVEKLDVDRLESRSASRLWSSLRGSRAGDLERERAEVAEVQAALERAGAQLEPLHEEVGRLSRRATQLEGADRDYEAALEAVAGATPTPAADITGPTQEAARELARRREARDIEKVSTAARSALQGLLAAEDVLQRADAWSTYDTFGGGGTFSSGMKHERLDEARQRLQVAGDSLKRLASLLDDATIRAVALPEFSALTRGLDIWWDNIFSDLTVFTEIKRCRDELADAVVGVRKVLASVEQRRAALSSELAAR
ncbi:MAG: hypothetical protein ABI112_11030 [Terracoccus sp.]